ncbi:MAG: hypothetical protein CMJ44_17175 [Pimelobacter sp.]|nr:hypothetical protein [Pimelobacter sp.]
MTTLAVEVAQEVLVVVRGDHLLRSLTLGQVGPLRHQAALLEDADEEIGRHREQDQHEQEPQHPSNVIPWWSRHTLNPVKEFWVYTLARLALFVVTWVAVTGIAALVTGEPYPVVTLLIAFLISGVGSYVVLRGPREALARKVEERASRASQRYERMRSSEDVD